MMQKSIACWIICIFLISQSSFAQKQETNAAASPKSQTDLSLARSIRLDKDSKTEEVIIEVKQKTQNMEVRVSSVIRGGKLTIEIYDPNEVRQGNFTVGTQLNSEKKETVNGNISKLVTEPLPGNWKIRIIPTEATGDIRIQSMMIE